MDTSHIGFPFPDCKYAKNDQYYLSVLQTPSVLRSNTHSNSQHPDFFCFFSFSSKSSAGGTYIGGCDDSCFNALRATVWNACSTFVLSLAEVSKNGISFLFLHQERAFASATCLFVFAKSLLFPNTTNGNSFGFLGAACAINSSIHKSKESNDF